jgi:hypothetical protein
MRKNKRRELRPRNWRRQRVVLCDVMLAARQCETWFSLHELARLTAYGETSVSAQLRHLRKPEYGGFAVGEALPLGGPGDSRRRRSGVGAPTATRVADVLYAGGRD